ncbi:MAG: hypothetical protein JWM47_4050 [Acidimicrobiales bacterium]|nr:hypothetical protein [Acidimicrobiales bacterium]
MNEDKKWQGTAIIRAMCDFATLLGMDATHAVQYCFGDLTMTLDRTGLRGVEGIMQNFGKNNGESHDDCYFLPSVEHASTRPPTPARAASSLVIYLGTPVSAGKLLMGRKCFCTRSYDWDPPVKDDEGKGRKSINGFPVNGSATASVGS